MDIWIESPYAIKHSSGIQRIKTDKADSSMIAEYGWRHQDKASLFKPIGKALEDLREVFLYRHKLVQQRVAMEIRDKGKESEETSKGLSFIRRKARHLIAELDRTIKECDLMIDRIIDSEEELMENYRIVSPDKMGRVCLSTRITSPDLRWMPERSHAIMESPRSARNREPVFILRPEQVTSPIN